MPKIIPIRDLRDTGRLSELCSESREPIFITKNGYGDMVVMSMETYDELLETAAIDAAITEAEAELADAGKLFDAREELKALRRKYFG